LLDRHSHDLIESPRRHLDIKSFGKMIVNNKMRRKVCICKKVMASRSIGVLRPQISLSDVSPCDLSCVDMPHEQMPRETQSQLRIPSLLSNADSEIIH
jgi:hypothetical protein